MLAKALVALLDSVESPFWTDTSLEAEALMDAAEVILVSLKTADPTAPKLLKQSHAVIVSHSPRMQAELLDQLTNARVIVRNGVGFDNVDVESAQRLGKSL